METYHYILGVHAVRLTMDEDGIIERCERFDVNTGAFVSDTRTGIRVANSTETTKVSAYELAVFCQQARTAHVRAEAAREEARERTRQGRG